MGLPIQKDAEGHKIMLRLCKPKKPSKKDPSEWDNDPVKLQKLYDYCIRDVEAEECLSQALEPLTASELKVWQLDQRINLRGLHVDQDALRNALAIVEETYEGCCKSISEATGGVISTPKQVAKIREWMLTNYEVDMENLAAETVEKMLESETLPDGARAVLQLRQLAGKASTSKLQSMLDRCDEDGRVRGNLVYHGAATGRWAGSGIQIQNYPRGTLTPDEIETVHRVLPARSGQALDLLLGPPIDCLSSSLRSMICAEPGNRLLAGDFASIEARVLAWIANQSDLVQAFRDGTDVYVGMASKIYDVPEDEVIKTQRQVGKVAILGLGFGMGHKAFRDAAKKMAGVEITNKFARQVVKTYRDTNPKIRQFWGDLNTAAIRAIETGQPHRVGRLEMLPDDDWLKIRLSSGRCLHYRWPRIVQVIAPWSEGHYGIIYGPDELEDVLEDLDVTLGDRIADGWIECNLPKGVAKILQSKKIRMELELKEPKKIPQIQYYSVEGPARKWQKTRTYGGKLTENVVQAIARDFLAEAMLRIEKAGYPIVATVHDEIVCELENDKGSLEEFETIMRQCPTWGAGCPIGVEGFEAKRYRK